MNFTTFLKANNETVKSFADAHKVPETTVWRATKGKPLRPKNAALIEKATGGAVSLRELLFPEKQSGASPANAATNADDVAPRT